MAASAHPTQPAQPPFERWASARAPTLTRLAYLLTGSAEQADVVVEDALASACLRWRRFAASPQLESMVRRLVVRACVRRHAHRRPADRDRDRGSDRGRHHAEGAEASPAGVDVQPWPVLGSADEPDPASTLVWRRCETLSPRQRAALVLCCHEGFGAADIAATVGGRTRAAAADVDLALAVVAPGAAGDRSGRARRVQQVGRVLQECAEAAPRVLAPAERARARARRRRRHRLAAAAAAVAVVLPVGWVGATDDEAPARRGPRVAPGSVLSPAALGGWRWESWGGVQVQVPAGWGQGDLTQWCVRAGPHGPAVDRPELRGPHAPCSAYADGRPTYTAGLLLRRAEDGPRLSRADVAPSASARIRTVGGVTLTVVDMDPAVGSAILASAEVVGPRDVNGCTPRRDSTPSAPSARSANRSPGAPIPRAGPVVAVSVCRYGLNGWPHPTLLSSRLLSGGPADRLVAAVRSAPVRAPSSAPGGCRLPAQEFAVLELWAGYSTGRPTSVVLNYDGCRGHAIDDGTSVRGLTAPVLAPVLVPPYTGRLTGDVPHLATVRHPGSR